MLEQISQLPTSMLAVFASFFGLLIGSFLNVVIYRYPKMIHYAWTKQSQQWLELDTEGDERPPSLLRPRSRCRNCQTPIKAWHNIPIISYLALGGKCGSCGAGIGLRYPLVELLTAVTTGVVVWHFGWSIQAAFAVLLTWVLIALSFIDIDHQILPDEIVLPILWLGVGLSLFNIYTDNVSSVIGAIAGYLSFWIVFQLFLLLTGKEGMGHGDFKLLSLFGAWLGWQHLPQIIFVSTMVGSVFGIALMMINRKGRDMKIPFGPYIATAGWIALLWGAEINRAYLDYANL